MTREATEADVERMKEYLERKGATSPYAGGLLDVNTAWQQEDWITRWWSAARVLFRYSERFFGDTSPAFSAVMAHYCNMECDVHPYSLHGAWIDDAIFEAFHRHRRDTTQ